MATPNDFFSTPTSFLTPSYASPLNINPQPIQPILPQTDSSQQPIPQQQPMNPIFEQISSRIPTALQQSSINSSSSSKNNGSNINIMSLVGPNLTITSYTSSKQQPNSTIQANNPRNVNTAIFQQIHSVVESMQEKEKQQQAQFEKQIMQMIMQQKQRQQQYQQQQQKSGPIYASSQLTTSAPLYHPYQRPTTVNTATTAAASKPSLPRIASDDFLSSNLLLTTPPPPPVPASPISLIQTPQPQQTSTTLLESIINTTNALTSDQQQQQLFQQLMGIPDSNGAASTGMSSSLFEDLGEPNFLDSILGTSNSNI